LHPPNCGGLSDKLLVVVDRGGLRILVVEDDEGVRTSVIEILRVSGYVVDQASEGIEALAKLSAQSFDAIVLDLALPQLDGIAVLEAQLRPPPVIIVSALEYYDKDEVMAQLGEKIFAVLQKPVDPQLLLSTLERTFETDGQDR
jgi:two-component system response regulator VanR